MATYKFNGVTYKIGNPTNIIEQNICHHISHHARMIDKYNDMIYHTKEMCNAGITINEEGIPLFENEIKWHERFLEKYCKDYQNPLKINPLKRK